MCGCVADDIVCTQCHSRYVACGIKRCDQCALPLPPGLRTTSRCGACLASPPAFDATIAVTDYAPPVDQLVLALKFGGKLALAPYFGRMIAERTLESIPENLPSLLIPVPLGKDRLAVRGFNQALEIGRSASAILKIDIAPRSLQRARETRAQTLLSPEERRRNLRHAFAAVGDGNHRFQNLHIGVVDDVMTTGETLNEMAVTLKNLGASRVTNLIFTRTVSRF
jgi:ComF family protein